MIQTVDALDEHLGELERLLELAEQSLVGQARLTARCVVASVPAVQRESLVELVEILRASPNGEELLRAISLHPRIAGLLTCTTRIGSASG